MGVPKTFDVTPKITHSILQNKHDTTASTTLLIARPEILFHILWVEVVDEIYSDHVRVIAESARHGRRTVVEALVDLSIRRSEEIHRADALHLRAGLGESIACGDRASRSTFGRSMSICDLVGCRPRLPPTRGGSVPPPERDPLIMDGRL